jgi:hypothetical protein
MYVIRKNRETPHGVFLISRLTNAGETYVCTTRGGERKIRAKKGQTGKIKLGG